LASREELQRLHTYFTPTKIVFGLGAVDTVGKEAKALGATDALIVTDKALRAHHLVEKVAEPLETKTVNVTIYDEISAEPTMDSVGKAVTFARKGRYDLVVGVGGGSAMDTAKIVAGLMSNPGDPADLIDPTKDKFEKPFIHKMMVPTASGTGSEVSNVAVVITEGYKTFTAGPKVFPDVSLIDPQMTVTLPPSQTAACSLDALSQVIEPMLSKEENPVRDALAFSVISLISSSLRSAFYNGADLEARWNLAIAATMGGLVMNVSACGYPAHAFAEVFGPMFEVPHGAACGLALPYIMAYDRPAAYSRLASIASAMGETIMGLAPREATEKAIEAVLGLTKDVHLPLSLRSYGIKEADLPAIKDKVLFLMRKVYSTSDYNLRTIEENDVDALLGQMWRGDLAA
jgi:alcohol dehydrogenase class IV